MFKYEKELRFFLISITIHTFTKFWTKKSQTHIQSLVGENVESGVTQAQNCAFFLSARLAKNEKRRNTTYFRSCYAFDYSIQKTDRRITWRSCDHCSQPFKVG